MDRLTLEGFSKFINKYIGLIPMCFASMLVWLMIDDPFMAKVLFSFVLTRGLSHCEGVGNWFCKVWGHQSVTFCSLARARVIFMFKGVRVSKPR